MASPETVYRVPEQLTPLIDDRARGLHDMWQKMSHSDWLGLMPGTELVPVSDTQSVKIAEVNPPGDYDPERALVLFLPHAQAWKPHMWMRAAVARQLAAPDSRMIVFPNNGYKDEAYTLSDHDTSKGYKPLAEQFARVLEKKGVGQVALVGYSLGGILAPAVAAVNSDKFQTLHIGSFEAPNVNRTDKELKDAFMADGLGNFRASVADAEIPALSKAMSLGRFGLDLYKFWRTNATDPTNQYLTKMMEKGLLTNKLLVEAGAVDPETVITVGRMATSAIAASPKALPGNFVLHSVDRFNFRSYSGPYDHGHTTGDNIFAHGLMIKDALGASNPSHS